jgi:hypothetical protein
MAVKIALDGLGDWVLGPGYWVCEKLDVWSMWHEVSG